jgi:hypothetical protein
MSEAPQPSAAADSDVRKPEWKIGPFAGGVGVAIWLNTAETNDGPRQFRSVKISPRRYQEQGTGKWKDAKSFQVGDLPILMFALQQAQEYMIQHPLRNADAGTVNEGDDIPF